MEEYDNQHMSVDDLTPDDDYDNEPVMEFTDDDLPYFVDMFDEIMAENEENFDWDAWLTADNERKNREAAEADLTITMEDNNVQTEQH